MKLNLKYDRESGIYILLYRLDLIPPLIILIIGSCNKRIWGQVKSGDLYRSMLIWSTLKNKHKNDKHVFDKMKRSLVCPLLFDQLLLFKSRDIETWLDIAE